MPTSTTMESLLNRLRMRSTAVVYDLFNLCSVNTDRYPVPDNDHVRGTGTFDPSLDNVSQVAWDAGSASLFP